jgi:hypothetical protein
METIKEVTKQKCLRCEYEWEPRKENPEDIRACPKCKSYSWGTAKEPTHAEA